MICQPSSQAILSTASYLINVLLHIPKSSKYLLGWIHLDLGLLRWRSCKELTCHCRKFKRHKFNPWKDPLKEEMETHSSILAWRIPWTEDPGGLWSIESELDTTEATSCMPVPRLNPSGKIQLFDYSQTLAYLVYFLLV